MECYVFLIQCELLFNLFLLGNGGQFLGLGFSFSISLGFCHLSLGSLFGLSLGFGGNLLFLGLLFLSSDAIILGLLHSLLLLLLFCSQGLGFLLLFRLLRLLSSGLFLSFFGGNLLLSLFLLGSFLFGLLSFGSLLLFVFSGLLLSSCCLLCFSLRTGSGGHVSSRFLNFFNGGILIFNYFE